MATAVTSPIVEEKRSGWKEAAESKQSAETPIQNAYSFSFIKRNTGSKNAGEVETYEKSIKDLGEFKTVQGFWRTYNHLMRPNDLPNSIDYHLFKAGIKPMWEDPANRKGGKWMVRVRKGIASRYWEDLVLAIIGEQFDVGNEICGAVVSIRYTEDVISLWNRNADNNEACYRIRDTMRRVLNLPQFVALEYKRHDTSMNDNSRQSNVWRDQRNSQQNERSSSVGPNGSSQREGGGGERGERRENSSRFPRDHRSDRTPGSSGRDGSSRNAWSREGKRPVFMKATSEIRDSVGQRTSPRGSAAPFAWHKQQSM